METMNTKSYNMLMILIFALLIFIHEVFDVLRIYEAASGAKVNFSKTEGLWIGGNKNLIKWTVFGTYGGIDWENEKV